MFKRYGPLPASSLVISSPNLHILTVNFPKFVDGSQDGCNLLQLDDCPTYQIRLGYAGLPNIWHFVQSYVTVALDRHLARVAPIIGRPGTLCRGLQDQGSITWSCGPGELGFGTGNNFGPRAAAKTLPCTSSCRGKKDHTPIEVGVVRAFLDAFRMCSGCERLAFFVSALFVEGDWNTNSPVVCPGTPFKSRSGMEFQQLSTAWVEQESCAAHWKHSSYSADRVDSDAAPVSL